MPRRTISVPEYLDARVASIARERGTSYSATVVRLLDEATKGQPLPYEGLGEGPEDFSERFEEYLGEMLDELRP
ncbi:MAG: hypothetical protein ACRDYX_08505 [Egibacteraceae bacterium]